MGPLPFPYVHDKGRTLQARRVRCAALVEQVRALPWERKEQSEWCVGAPIAVIAEQDRYGIPLRAGMCLESGLVFLMDRLTLEGYAAFYQDFYRPFVSQFWAGPFDLKAFRKQGRRYGNAVFESIASRLPAASSARPTLLDIGGSTGHVAQVFAERANYHATVLDPAPDELQVAADSGLEVAEGFLETYDAEGRQFDLVLLCQTIDHLLDLRGSLARIYDLVKPGGFFLWTSSTSMRCVSRKHRSRPLCTWITVTIFRRRPRCGCLHRWGGTLCMWTLRYSGPARWGTCSAGATLRPTPLPGLPTCSNACGLSSA